MLMLTIIVQMYDAGWHDIVNVDVSVLDRSGDINCRE
jgi:hypothetical protein